MGTMDRIWSEARNLHVPEGGGHRFRAAIVADRGTNADGRAVLRIEKFLLHWKPDAEEPCETPCGLCEGDLRHEVIADPVHWSREDSIRIAITHADALFKEAGEAVNDAHRILFPSPPEAEAAPELAREESRP